MSTRKFAIGTVDEVSRACVDAGAYNCGTDEQPDCYVYGERAYLHDEENRELVGVDMRAEVADGDLLSAFDACVAAGLPVLDLTFEEAVDQFGMDVVEQLILHRC